MSKSEEKKQKRIELIERYENREQKVRQLRQLLGIRIDDIDLAARALTCSDFAAKYYDATKQVIPTQDALATLGDAVIKLVVAETLYRENPAITCGELTLWKSKLEKDKALQGLGERLHLGDYLLYTNTDLKGTAKLATTIEAIAGAIYLDRGKRAVVSFWKHIHRIAESVLKPSNTVYDGSLNEEERSV